MCPDLDGDVGVCAGCVCPDLDGDVGVCAGRVCPDLDGDAGVAAGWVRVEQHGVGLGLQLGVPLQGDGERSILPRRLRAVQHELDPDLCLVHVCHAQTLD